MSKEQFERFFSAMLAADRSGANEIASAWAAEHGHKSAVGDLLEPALARLGGLWDDKEVSLAQGYIAAKIAGDLFELAAEAESGSEDDGYEIRKGPVVVGNIEDDFHALGRRLVVTFLKTAGWKVYDLGNDVPPQEFVDKAVEVGAKVIGASAMMASTASNIGLLRKEIDRRGLTGQIQLAVGGAIFRLRPELVDEVGGDGTTANALGAPVLFERLWNAAETS